MNELIEMGKKAAMALIAAHQRNGTLLEYMQRIAPEYIDNGQPMWVSMLQDIGF